MEAQSTEDGFTLIELLVVVIIIGILSGIAIPSFLSQRDNGYRAQMTSDLRNAALRMEQGYTANDGVYVASAMVGFRTTRGVLTVTDIRNDNTFCLTSTVDGVGFRTYDSRAGGIQDVGSPCT